MKGFVFLDAEDVLHMQRHLVDVYGGEDGVRDLGLLESAVAMPQATFGGKWLHTDIFEMAAAYLFHIVKNHPFVDGNKRAGALSAFVFLQLNGYDLTATPNEFSEIVLAVAEGRLDKSGVADFFRRHTRLI